MNALWGVCVATKRRLCVERACSSAAGVEIKFVLFSGPAIAQRMRGQIPRESTPSRARGTMRGEASEPVVLANAAARVACGSLSVLFIFTMVAFTTLRVFGLKRVLVPRSGIIGVGVAWTIAVSGIGMVGYRIEPTTIAPCQPLHALLVNLPQQAVFLLSLRMRRLVTTWGAIRLFGTFAIGVVLLNVAHEFAHGERETIAGAPKKDGSVEVLDVTDATVNLFVAFARAAAGLLLVQGSSEREGAAVANSAPRKTTGSPQELCLASCWCVMLVLMSLPRFGNESPWGDPLGGARARGAGALKAGERAWVVWYGFKASLYVLAQWGGLLAVKLSPSRLLDKVNSERAREKEKADAKKRN